LKYKIVTKLIILQIQSIWVAMKSLMIGLNKIDHIFPLLENVLLLWLFVVNVPIYI
jgi:hypothetical protein